MLAADFWQVERILIEANVVIIGSVYFWEIIATPLMFF